MCELADLGEGLATSELGPRSAEPVAAALGGWKKRQAGQLGQSAAALARAAVVEASSRSLPD